MIFSIALISLFNANLSFAHLPENYQNLTSKQKQNILWENISKTPYSAEELSSKLKDPNIFKTLSLFSADFLMSTFLHVSDEMPLDRLKLIHTYGSAAKVELEIDPSSPFTGIFQTGGHGIVRLSIAKQKSPFTPGMALKILIDENPSLNFHVMNSLDGQDSTNFFEREFSNVILPPSFGNPAQLLEAPFQRAVDRLQPNGPESPINLPLFQAASQERSGRLVQAPVVPYQIIFTPSRDIPLNEKDYELNYRVYLAQIPAGTILYTVNLKLNKNDKPVTVGKLVLKSQFVASKYEDETLFFQHTNLRK